MMTVTARIRCRLAQSMERMRLYDSEHRTDQAQEMLGDVLRDLRLLREVDDKLVKA